MAVNATRKKVLFISDDAAVAAVIRHAVAQPGDSLFMMVWERSLSAGIARLFEGGIDAILLDLYLPDGQGMDCFNRVFLAARGIPIVVLTDRDQEEIARQAVERGGKDRMLKKHIDRYSFGLVLRQILARAASEDALYAERERARVTLNSIGDAVISTDQAGHVTYINPAAEKMTGWLRDDARGRALTEVFHLLDGDTREPAPNPMELAVQKNQIVGLPHHAVLLRPDGSESAIEDSIAAIHDKDGQITGAVMVFRDVSEARAIELKLSHLAQHDGLAINRPPQPLHRAGGAPQATARGAVHRPRPLQADKRFAGACGRRQSAASSGEAAHGCRPRFGHRGSTGRG